jgi:WD40 repeat protein
MVQKQDEDRTQWTGEPGNVPDSDKTIASTEPESFDEYQNDAVASDGSIALDWKPGDVVLDLYEVKEVFTTGGMGLVYHVHHRNWNIDLIIKNPRPEVIAQAGGTESFIAEAETWVDLGLHPNIVTCHYVRTIGGIPMVFAEYVDGGSLKDWIVRGDLYKDGSEGSLERILDVSMQFAWGLHYAHQKGLVHRDVKPANVLMTKGGSVKVTDFGLAKARIQVTGATNNDEEPSQSGQKTKAMMTPAYCSPEQAERAALASQETPVSVLPELTTATDVWSWALSVMEMFIGGITWTTGLAGPMVLENYLDECKQDKSLQEPLQEGLPDMPQKLASLLKKCLKPDPAKRPSNMAEIIEEMKGIYLKSTGQDYTKEFYEPSELRGDNLNNKALSMLDLGYESKAKTLLEQALTMDPTHADVIYNLLILQWRRGEIDDLKVIAKLEWQRELAHERMPWDEMIARVHMERGDFSSASKILEGLPSQPELTELKKTIENSTNLIDNGLAFMDHENPVTSIDFSSDGRLAVSGSTNDLNNKNVLLIWDLVTGQVIRSFEGYNHHVRSVAFHPSGRYVLAGYVDGVVRRWSINGGRPQSEFVNLTQEQKTPGPVMSIACSPDGLCVLTSSGKNLYLWELQTEALKSTFSGHLGDVVDADFSPDGSMIVSCGSASNEDDQSLIVMWEVRTGKQVKIFRQPNKVYSVSFSEDGKQLLTAGLWGLCLWDVKSGKRLRTYGSENEKTRHACFSPSNETILESQSGYLRYDKAFLRAYDKHSGKCINTKELQSSQVQMKFLPDVRRFTLLEQSADGLSNVIRLCYLNEKSYLLSPLRLSAPKSSVEVIDLEKLYQEELNFAKTEIQMGRYTKALTHLRAARMLPGYEQGEDATGLWYSLYSRCWRTTLKSLRDQKVILSQGEAIVSPDGKSTAIYRCWGCSKGVIRIQTSDEQNVDKKIDVQDYIYQVLFRPRSKEILTACDDGTLKMWNTESLEKVRTYFGHSDKVTTVSFSPDGRQILSGGVDKRAILWDAETGKPLKILKGHQEGISAVAINPNGWLVATASYQMNRKDYSIRLWDAKTAKCLAMIPNQYGITSLCFGSNGRYLMAGCVDNNVYFFDAMSGKMMLTMKGHSQRVNTVAFSHENRFGISGSNDKTIRIWDLAKGECLFVLNKHQSEVHNVSISDNSQHLRSCSNGEVIIWQLEWDLAAYDEMDWHANAQRFIDLFIESHTPVADGIFRKKTEKPCWTEDDFQVLMATLGRAGYGWIRAEGVRKKLLEQIT